MHEIGKPPDAATLRAAMTRAYGDTEAAGDRVRKDVYEAAAVATVLFLQHGGRAMRWNAGAEPAGLRRIPGMRDAIAKLEPSHTKRSSGRRAAGSNPTHDRGPLAGLDAEAGTGNLAPLRLGGPVSIMSRFLGHINIRMTLRYACPGDRTVEAAEERVGISISAIMCMENDGSSGVLASNRRYTPFD